MIRFLQKPGPIKKIVLGGLLVIVCVMMVITLIPGGGFLNDLFGGGLTAQGVLARVGNQDIGVQEVAQQARRIAKQQFKGNVPPGIMSYIMPRAAESVIAQKMLVFEADRMGLGVSNEELSNALHQGQMGQVLFPGGKFIGEQEYEMLIQNQFNLSVAQFEQEVKGEIAQRKLLSLITAPVSVSDKDISEEVMKHDTKVKFEYAVLTLDDIKKQIKPTDAELKAFYEQYKQQVAPYLRGWESVVGHQRTGVYGNSKTIDWALQDGLGSYFWQHNWGSPGGYTHPAANLHQVEIDKRNVGGVGVDINNICKPQFGQWA